MFTFPYFDHSLVHPRVLPARRHRCIDGTHGSLIQYSTCRVAFQGQLASVFFGLGLLLGVAMRNSSVARFHAQVICGNLRIAENERDTRRTLGIQHQAGVLRLRQGDDVTHRHPKPCS